MTNYTSPRVRTKHPRWVMPEATACVDAERSEEHTSELQSQSNLVCRLLLEKKKTSIHSGSLPPPATLSPRHRCIPARQRCHGRRQPPSMQSPHRVSPLFGCCSVSVLSPAHH